MNWIGFGRSNRKRLKKDLIKRHVSLRHNTQFLLFQLKEYVNLGDSKYFYVINEKHQITRIL